MATNGPKRRLTDPQRPSNTVDNLLSSTHTIHGTDAGSVIRTDDGSVIRTDGGPVVRMDDGSVVRTDNETVVRTEDSTFPQGLR